jgi:hypothetical protein
MTKNVKKLQTEREFRDCRGGGFIANAERDLYPYRGYIRYVMLHESDCRTFSVPYDRHHVDGQTDKYFSRSLG